MTADITSHVSIIRHIQARAPKRFVRKVLGISSKSYRCNTAINQTVLVKGTVDWVDIYFLGKPVCDAHHRRSYVKADFERLRRLLEARMNKRGRKEYIEILRPLETFSIGKVEHAIGQTHHLGVLSFDTIKHLVLLGEPAIDQFRHKTVRSCLNGCLCIKKTAPCDDRSSQINSLFASELREPRSIADNPASISQT